MVKGFCVHTGIKHRGDSYQRELDPRNRHGISMCTCVCCSPSLVIPSDCHLGKLMEKMF